MTGYKYLCVRMLLYFVALQPVLSQPSDASLFPDKIRAGYNYNASLDFYHIAKECGLNTIIRKPSKMRKTL